LKLRTPNFLALGFDFEPLLAPVDGVGYDPRMYPILLQIGPITIYSYGVMMALGFLAANWVVGKGLQYQGKDPNFSSTLVVWAAVGGLLGARLLFVVERLPEFFTDPLSMIFTGAGFTWYGGLIGGVVGVTLCIQRYKLSWLEVMDAVAPGIALGHGIGRIGCHLAGDGDWGPPTTLPWGVAYTDAIVGWDYPPGVRVHPSALYETIAYTIIFAILWRYRRVPRTAGSLFWGYLLLSSLSRFLIEFLRINPPLAFGLSEAQIISILLMIIGAGMLLWRTVDNPITGTASLSRIAREKQR
jgi:phosphatidylglycerol---prolipoprotein diacylglyceryl transferase